jgi:4-hydroxythreonine-4-phosphate dehydrogenase
MLVPTVARLQAKGVEIEGPFPADGFFGSRQYQQFDAILSTYHDQGLVPFKLLSFGKGVNFTAGLPFIRTSPDHGTAFGIAGKGAADAGSFLAAVRLAADLVRRQRSIR